MAKTLELQVENDHLISLTRVNGLSALRELVWNSLDADATEININYDRDSLDSVNRIIIDDNGHGIAYEEAIEAFSSLGGSAKKNKQHSPGNRILHGEEGKGRFRVFALGGLITFRSVYEDDGQKKSFNIILDENQLKNPKVEEPTPVSDNQETGVSVTIQNVKKNISKGTFGRSTVNKLAQTFAVYHQAYDFEIYIETEKIDFDSVVKNVHQKTFKVNDDGVKYEFSAKIIEWNFETGTELYFCNEDGIAYQETYLGYNPSLAITVYLLSDYIDDLHRDSKLQLDNLDIVLNSAKEQIRDLTKDYVKNRKHENARSIIEKLKKEDLYPYKREPETPTEEAERQVFDIVTLEVHESLADFEDQPRKSKKLTLQLLKEALENDRSDLQAILREIVELPAEKIRELGEILEKTSLTTIIDTMKEIQDRLRIIYELRELLYNEDYKDQILERKHLHKIVANETWIFGDDFTYGADDVTLRNVLKAHVNYLGRDNVVEDLGSNKKLNRNIPDVCLWKQYKRGNSGHFKNLVIELKRPNKKITLTEIEQIKRYAREVYKDERFTKEKTEWIFILLSTGMNEDAELECDQSDREWGHIDSKDGLEVYVKRWGDILSEAEARHEYLKEKLGYEVSEKEEGIALLKRKYEEYLPNELTKTGS